MRLTRFAVTASSFAFWPSIVAISAGITFGAARVYAEAGMPGPRHCTEREFTACADAGHMQACQVEGYEGEFACAPSATGCISDDSPGEPKSALACSGVSTCNAIEALLKEACERKSVGSSCELPEASRDWYGWTTGRCAEAPCRSKNDAGFYEESSQLACSPPATDDGTKDDDSEPQINPTNDAAKDSGCATTPGMIPGAALFAVPLGLGLILAYRRKQRR